ncbi:MAG: restriction endonuclease subunit M [Deltaproteobacteria bacterium HGW-Deltaproteobacteria-9]|nr:MAG: restriction endonuclease subunit M [Deltaproteobacteria bacterium HGW-Deltaproteobacteria-9]
MTAPKEILDLLERFDRNRDAYRSGNYNETQLRREFVDPFFKTLGWDIDNAAGIAEAYKEVIHEDAIKVGGATKAPDYCFRVGGTRKFFVEAKKPSVNIAEDIGPAYQLRRYAWSAKLPLSILTDFEEFAVYDCRIKPDKSDKASTARIMYLTERDYLARWEEIAAIFSRDAVWKGSFDKYADTARLKKGTAGVDAAFLKEIETWREMLARNIALRNPRLSQRELNAAVTLTINRIIFLRICEDRGIETYGQLMALKNGSDIYERLIKIYYAADDKYNSGLFHFRTEKDRPASPDTLTLNLAIDDKTLKDIFGSLYYPDSPYEFSVLPADILGQVYEQFLGKVIHLTAGHRAKVEDKPEVKKAGGVYYTPTYIVDYIVKNTVGKLLPSSNSNGDTTPAKSRKAVTPRQAAEIRILDPACGSGSFLLGAYQYLLDWHLGWYVNNGTEKWIKGKSPVLCRGPGGDWRLTTTERKRILLNNIYGVDIDPQAVEVTKLSLLLKVLEGENEQTLSNQLRLFRERALPDLGNNIKCGNSLIGPDFYDNQQLGFFDDEERYRINVFDWQAEFPEIFTSKAPSPPAGEGRGEGGFDAVIGNPPYGFHQIHEEYLKPYFKKYFLSSHGSFENYFLFYEKSLKLLKQNGLHGFIVPVTWLTIPSAQSLREFILTRYWIQEVCWLPEFVFAKAKVNTLISIIKKSQACSVSIKIYNELGFRKPPKEERTHIQSQFSSTPTYN